MAVTGKHKGFLMKASIPGHVSSLVRALRSQETGVLLLPRFHLESDLKEYS